jgi:aldose 1-epimerase
MLAGFPGAVDVTVTYTLSSDCELLTEMEAKAVGRATPVNLANHSYFNLAGHASGKVLDHQVQLWSWAYTLLDETQIPTGAVVPVKGTPLDFTSMTSIGSRIGEVPGGYDHNYDLRTERSNLSQASTLQLAAKVWEPTSKRVLEVSTTAPGVQFYTGNSLPVDGIVGKDNAIYSIHTGFCLETQGFPNAVNEPSFPSTIVRPGEPYRHVMVYKFYTQP